MSFASKNMHYVFNVSYFEGLDLIKTNNNDEKIKMEISDRNEQIRRFPFSVSAPFKELREGGVQGFRSFRLYTTYPGLLIGTGNPHDTKLESAVKCGFSFDYVTGLPYIPGSSLKGLLRSYFKEPVFIKTLLNHKELSDGDIRKLESDCFEKGDVFLGAYPVRTIGGTLLEMEYITPHPDVYKDPVPISIMKVKPNIGFEFCFILQDSEEPAVSASEKEALYKSVLKEMGVGAKTDVGFGRMAESLAKPNKMDFDNESLRLVPDPSKAVRKQEEKKPTVTLRLEAGKCPKCGAPVKETKGRIECTKKCGMTFSPYVNQYTLTTEEYMQLLSGAAVHVDDFIDDSGKKGPVDIKIDGTKSLFKQVIPNWEITPSK